MTKNKVFSRVLSAVICAVLLIGCLYVPVSLNAFAESQTTVYDFSYCVDNATNKNAATNDGVGYFGWGLSRADNMLVGEITNSNQDWPTSGAYRLHDENGLCHLEPSSTYIVSLKIKVAAGVKQVGSMTLDKSTTVSLGWGTSFNPNLGGSETNYTNTMTDKVINVFTSVCESESYSLNTGAGIVDATYSNEWKTVIYELKTPEDFGGKDNVLAIWIGKWQGIKCYIDDVSVTKLGANQGVVVAVDEYTGTRDVYMGDVGETVTLPDISDRAQQDDHTFEGWYKDTGRTEAVTQVSIAENMQSVYSKWNAPVVYTFKHTLTGEDIVVSGIPGEAIEYPADPVDETGEKWFMGWYTTEACTEEFTEQYFAYVNKNIYSLFKSETPELKQDFENYNKEVWTPTTASNGDNEKSNCGYFANMMEKQSAVTYGGSGYAVKFNWDSTMSKIPSDPNTYNTSNRYNQKDMYFWLGSGIDDKTQYIVTFKYKVEKTDADLIFYAVSAISDNIWGNCKTYTGVTVKNADLKNEWQEVSFPITTAFQNAGANTMYLGVKLSKNTDTVVYFDDVEIKAAMQPYQSKIIVSDGVNEEYELMGRRGEAVVLTTPVNPSGAEFKGWYLDDKYTISADSAVYERLPYTIYAKWGAAPLTFKDYPYPTTADNGQFGKLVHIDDSGLGIDDDYSLRFDYKGNYVYGVDAEGKDVFYNTRTGQRDHCATIAQKVKNNTYYRITYNYKIIDANAEVIFRLCSGLSYNTWAADYYRAYPEVTQNANMTADGWQTVSYIVKSNLNNSGDSFFIIFNVGDNSKDAYVDVVVDNVLVEEFTGNYILFDGNADGAEKQIVEGKAGEPFQIPTVKYDKSQLLGWYTDKECTTPFTATVMPEGGTIVYAKWKAGPMSFQTYPYHTAKDNCGFGELLSIDKSGLGVDGDNAVRFDFKGDYVYSNKDGKIVYYNTRTANSDHIFTIKTNVQNNAVYRITYKYKVLNANASVSIIPYSGYYPNIWVPGTSTKYSNAENTIKQGEATEWQTFTTYIITDLHEHNNHKATALYLVFNVGSMELSAVADVLVDDVFVETVEPPYVMFNLENGKPNVFVNGKVGDSIVYPENPVSFGRAFKGWYTDKECTTPFTAKTFTEGMTAVVYAGYNLASQFTYDFEKYDFLPKPFTPGSIYMEDALWVSTKYAKSGSGAIEFDRTGSYNVDSTFATIANGNAQFKVDKNRQYILTFSYCVTKKATNGFTMDFVTARDANCWDSTAVITPRIPFPISEQEVGVWHTKTVALDFSKIKYDTVFFRLTGGQDGIFLLDDVMVTVAPEGYGAVAIDNGGCKDVPSFLTGKIGTSYADKLTKAPKFEGKYFLGYFKKDATGNYNELKEDEMKFGETAKTVFARFIDYKVTQDFEGDFVDATKFYTGLNIFDFDYELYDATKEGNSRDNVTSGKYSLHRKGDSRYFESSAVLTPGNNIVAGARYKVSFKVKMVKNLHTDGAIKVASSRNHNYSWDTTGDWYPVVAIKDLTDGQWHEVSYIFNSVESFFAIQTPGYVELFIDDVVFDLITDDTPVSTPVQFTEYVPVRRDEKGNIIEVSADEIDVLSIVDTSLKLGNSGVGTTVIIISVAAGVALVAAAVVLLIVFKKKKAKKA